VKAQREDLRGLLLANAQIAGFVGDRIFPGLAPLNAAEPYITYQLNSAPRPRTHDQRAVPGRIKADRQEWLISVFDVDVDRASEIAELVDIALDGQQSPGGLRWLYDDAADVPDFKDDNSDVVLHQVAMNFICFRKPVAGA
jgi:hypothetical protein